MVYMTPSLRGPPGEQRVLMADKPNHSKLKFGAKSEFVRSLDPSIPAAEVVALAEKKGMRLTTALVYNIRSSANHAGRLGKIGSARANRRKLEYKAGSPEAQLRAAIAEIGLARAREILEEVEITFAGR